MCTKEILYNKYKMYRGKVLCNDCYAARLKRKAEKKATRRAIAKIANAKKDVDEYFPLQPDSADDKTDEVKLRTSDDEETK